jgi:hypothetical protein
MCVRIYIVIKLNITYGTKYREGAYIMKLFLTNNNKKEVYVSNNIEDIKTEILKQNANFNIVIHDGFLEASNINDINKAIEFAIVE